MTKSKMTLGGEALLAAAFLFATTNVLVRELAHMWGDQAQIAARFAVVWLIHCLLGVFIKPQIWNYSLHHIHLPSILF